MCFAQEVSSKLNYRFLLCCNNTGDVGEPHHIVFVAAVICLKRECVGVHSSLEIKDLLFLQAYPFSPLGCPSVGQSSRRPLFLWVLLIATPKLNCALFEIRRAML